MQVRSENKHSWAITGAALGAAFTLPYATSEILGQVDLLRNVKGLKPMLKGDSFEYLKESTDSKVFEYITKNKKLLYNPIFKKLGIAALVTASCCYLGSLSDKK